MSDVKLLSNLHNQVNRLVEQLSELEQERESLTEDEYNEMKKETLEELSEIRITMEKMAEGAISTMDSSSKEKQAILDRIAKAFQCIHGDQSQNRKQIAILRQKLVQVHNDLSNKKIDENVFSSRKCAVLNRLSDMGDILSIDEIQLIKDSSIQLNLSLQSASTSSKARDEFIDSL